MCSICGERLFTGAGDEPVCGDCLRQAPSFEKATAYGSYDGELRDLIHLLKYEGLRPAASVLGRMLAEAIADLQLNLAKVPPVMVPVPLHAGKLRARGFNQSRLIAEAALKHSWRARGIGIAPEVLLRVRATESQTGLTRAQRRQNVRGAFEVVDRNAVNGRDILVVDDVFTTGTTVSECARILRKAGAARVYVATVARVLKSEATFASLEETSGEALAVAAHA